MDFEFWPTEERPGNDDMTGSIQQSQSKGSYQNYEETVGERPAKRDRKGNPTSKQIRTSRNRGRPRLDPKEDNPIEVRALVSLSRQLILSLYNA